MGTSLDSRDDRHAYVGYILQNLNAFVVNLAPNAGIGGIAERGPLDISNELPTSAREDYDLVRSILRNSVEGIDKFRVRSRGHNEWPAVAVELNDKYAFGVARQLQITISGEVVILMCLPTLSRCGSRKNYIPSLECRIDSTRCSQEGFRWNR